jgi:hypothetical protein
MYLLEINIVKRENLRAVNQAAVRVFFGLPCAHVDAGLVLVGEVNQQEYPTGIVIRA